MKIVIISDDPNFNNNLNNVKIGTREVEIMGIFPTGGSAIQAIEKLDPMFVLMEPKVAYELNEAKTKLANTTPATRHYISANTHHGIQLLPISSVYFFQAEHKYVVAYHEKGELLINDSLIRLEQEFASIFIRIHRKILVAKKFIEGLEKTQDGHWQLILTNYPKKLIVSRRQLATIRKCINEDLAMNKYKKGLL